MKKHKILAAVLALSIVCGATAPCSFTLPNEQLTAFAKIESPYKVVDGIFTYYISSDHAVLSVCDKEASGDIIIPAETNGVPVTMIDGFAFSECSEITSVVMPDSITEIDHNRDTGAFSYCTSLKSVTLSSSLTSIGENAFKDCSSLESIILPDSVTVIKRAAFSGCKKLESINLSNVEEIGDNAFSGCRSLTSVDLCNLNTVILRGTFYNCKKLESINLSNVEEIGEEAFYGCESLKSIEIPYLVRNIQDGAFKGCTNLSSVYFDCDYFLKNYNYYKDLIDNNEEDDDLSFMGCEYIGYHAFEDCENLEFIELPSSVKTISPYAFRGCNKLSSLFIPDSVKSIGEDILKAKTGVKTIKGYAGSYAEEYAEENNIKFEAVNDPDKFVSGDEFAVSIIDKMVFAVYPDHAELTTYLTLPISNFEFGYHNYEDIDIPETVNNVPVTVICDHAFEGISEIDNVSIPDSVKIIGKAAFKGCNNLDFVDVNKVEIIDEDAFSGCKNLYCLYIHDAKNIGNHAFENCKSLNDIDLGDDIESIGEYAFSGCKNLESIDLSDSKLISLGAFAFNKCEKLKKIDFPIEDRYISTVEYIGDYAFSDCSELKEIEIPDTVISIGEKIFGNDSTDKVILGARFSHAAQYASDNNIEFHFGPHYVELPDPTTVRNGDVNSDGETGLADALAILQYIANSNKYPLSEEALKQADVYNTGDGVTPMDALAIQKLDAGLYDSLPVEES